ncbi:MAG: hypothetical protein H0W40_03345 [Methylibium sp.]|uniref:hypothetical protein n=1 Tax=Methylibium sp. TaxID=2067992 RepID=UPI0017CEB730|nr:hypothetical protein [Methylibium sp.]MBA3596399.1 hypothetical protein [Methylibium sp.]
MTVNDVSRRAAALPSRRSTWMAAASAPHWNVQVASTLESEASRLQTGAQVLFSNVALKRSTPCVSSQ